MFHSFTHRTQSYSSCCCLLQDVKLLVELTGYTMYQLQTPLQYLCALHTTLVQALLSGKPYAVSAKYRAPALHAVAFVAPLCDTRDPRLVL